MAFLLRMSRLIDALNERVGHAVYWLILAAVLVSAGNAMIRYSFDISSNGWLELQWYLFSAVFLLGGGLYAAAQRACPDRRHLRPSVAASRAWIDLLGGVFFLLPMAIMIMVLSWPVFVESFAAPRDFGGCRRAVALAGQAADPGRLSAAGAAGRLGDHQAHRVPARPYPRPARKAPASRWPKSCQGAARNDRVSDRQHGAADVRRRWSSSCCSATRWRSRWPPTVSSSASSRSISAC